VFSDELSFPKIIKINNHFGNRINCVFGIGTNLTNDVGIDPLQIVIKMTECNGRPVAKISDTPGKGMCRSEKYLKKLKKAFEI
jgi:nicotinate phosphoribosyltransferase